VKVALDLSYYIEGHQGQWVGHPRPLALWPSFISCPATGAILHGITEVTGMIFPRLPLHLMEFEGIWGQYLQLEVNKRPKSLALS
jgi:hypothetical protein